MYNPSRGGVRGGADQFTWESVKNDKHRENYLGHSLKAPVGRWQKGKDLSWYAKERNEANGSSKTDRSELASIKREEEEAMLIALGHNVKKTQALSKEDIREVLKRNTGESADHNIDRVNGVGASSQRVALLSGVGKDFRKNSEGVIFENYKEKASEPVDRSEKREEFPTEDRKKSKKSKKHKKEKKHKKHRKETHDSDSSDSVSKHRTKPKKNDSDNDKRRSSKLKNHKKSKHKHRDYSSDDSTVKHASYSRQRDHKKHNEQNDSVKKRRHDTSESD